MLSNTSPSFTSYDFNSLDRYIEYLCQISGDLEHKIYSSTDFYTKAKLLASDGVIYFHRYCNFVILFDSYINKDILIIDFPINKQEVVVNGVKYGENRQFCAKRNSSNKFFYSPGEKISLCIAKATLEKYLPDNEVEFLFDSVDWFQQHEISTKYKNSLIYFIRDRMLILENLIKLDYKQPLLFESITESVIHALLEYASFHKNYNRPIRIKNSERVLKRVFEYTSVCDISKLSITELSKNIHISSRSLQYIFKKEMDMTPKQFLTIEKLNQVRKELIAMGPDEFIEAEILEKYGISNFSRFRRHYQQFFNESLRDTLFRA